MKLSLKFREETNHHHNPLLRAKIPVTIAGFPFLSGIVGGDSSDLSFSLRSNFSSGPSLSLSYHPTLPSTTFPFSLSLKSGIGIFGSPHNSPLIFTANFNLFSSSSSNPNPNHSLTPTFSLQIKPQFGNFSLFKSVSSSNGHPQNDNLSNGSVPDYEITNGSGSFSLIKSVSSSNSTPIQLDGHPQNGKISNGSSPDIEINNGLGHGFGLGGVDLKNLKRESSRYGILSGIFVAARTCMPLTKRAMVNFRWGVNFPNGGSSNLNSNSKTQLPVLVMNKISLERVDEVKKVEENPKTGDLELLKGMYSWMRREVEDLQRENRVMKQELDGMRSRVPVSRSRGDEREVRGKRATPTPTPFPVGESVNEFERWRSKKGGGGVEENENRELKKSANRMSDIENELQKAIKAASS